MMFYFIAHLNDNEREQQMEQPKPMSLFRMSSFLKKKNRMSITSNCSVARSNSE